MATIDLDPLFVKALKLLHSRSKDATQQLKQMLDDAIAQRKAEVGSSKDGESSNDSFKPFSSYKMKKEKELEAKKREAEKRNFEKVKQELAELSTEVPAKKIKVETSGRSTPKSRSPDRDKSSREGKEKSKQPRLLQEIDIFKPQAERDREVAAMARERERMKERDKDKPDAKKEVRKVPIIASDSDSDEGSNDDDDDKKSKDDLVLDLGGDMGCVACKSGDAKPNNALVECQECHNLYHQECHRPPVTENVNDPRFVWYCSKCSKTMKKMASKPQKAKQGSSVASKEKESISLKSSKGEPSQLPFRRLDTSKPSSSTSKESSGNNSSSVRPLGLAGLAANLSGKSSDNNSKHASSSSAKHSAFPAFSRAASETSLKHSSSASKLSSLVSSAAAPSLSTTISRSGSSSNLGKLSSSSKSSQKASTSEAPSSSGSSTKLSSMMSADKRLQMMKKKAAAKNMEKRASANFK